MTKQEARKFGGKKTLRATMILVAIAFLIFLYMETRGDFANGMLFFLEEISNIHLVLILTILFGLTYVFGRKAGEEIILGKKNIFLISVKYVFIIFLAIIIYAAIIGIIKDKNSSPDNFRRLLITYFLMPLAETGRVVIIPMLCIWLLAANQMKLKGSENVK